MLYGLAIESEISAPEMPLLPAAPVTAEELRARAAISRLLAAVFGGEPGEAFVDALRAAQALESLEEAGLRFDADFTQTPGPLLADQLATEYATLFVAAGGFPPVESVRLTGRYQQEPYFDVRETYRRAGFVVARNGFFVFDDQLGAELSFVALLLERCAAAIELGQESACRRQEHELKRFWALHPGKWVRGYARLIQRAAEHSFYREMARLLEAFAHQEIQLLRLRIEDQDQGRALVPKSEVKAAFDRNEPARVCPGAPALRSEGRS